MFPASHDAVICIRATDSNGVYQPFNLPKDIDEGEVFGTLGVDVPAASLGDFPVPKSGTSVASAIAAGIAATLVHCGSAVSLDIRQKHRSQSGMKEMFRNISFITWQGNTHYTFTQGGMKIK